MPVQQKDKRVHGFFIQRSMDYETHDKDGQIISNISEVEWKRQVIDDWTSKIDPNDWILIIFHDKDVLINPDGTTSPKPLHAHALVRFGNAKTQSAVIKLMNLSRSGNCQPVKSYVDSARYLLHVSESALNAHKHMYRPDEVIEVNKKIEDAMSRGSNIGKKRLNGPEVNDYIDDLSARISKSKITLHRARLKLEEDFGEAKGHALWTRYSDRFDKDLRLALDDKARSFKVHDNRNLKTTYIYGVGGVGKSQLARAMARQLSNDDGNYYAAAAPDKGKTFDFTGGYKGENVTILDDCKSSVFDLRAFFSVFDPYQYSLSNSRNYDKAWLSEYAFLTCSDSYETWVNDLMLYSTNGAKYTRANQVESYDPYVSWHKEETRRDGWQVLRRTPIVIHVEPDKVGSLAHVYSLYEPFHSHLYLGSVSCSDVTNRQAVDKWGNDVLNLIKVNQPIQMDPITKSFLFPLDFGIGSIKTSDARKYILNH